MNENEDTLSEESNDIVASDESGKKPLKVNPKRTEHKKKKKWVGFTVAGAVIVALGFGGYYGYDYYMHADDVTVPKAQAFIQYEANQDTLCDDFEKVSLNCSVDWKVNDEADRGNLLSQSIASGSDVSSGSKIVLTYSDGPSSSEFPNLVGQDLEESKELLYGLGIVVKDVKEISDNSVPSGRIVTASIEPGTKVNHGDEVVIEISNGKTTIPDWTGQTKDFVEASASENNLTVEFTPVSSTDIAPGIVVNQSVKAGEVSTGENIKVTISEAPEIVDIAIPNVIGNTEEEAVSQLAAAGFTNLTVTVISSNVEARTVAEVSPGIGQSIASDDLVTLIVTEPIKAETAAPSTEEE